MAPIWWDKKGAFKALHDINVLRLGYINERAPLDGKRVLDLGCGGGILSEAMASIGAVVTGIDMGQAPLPLIETCSSSILFSGFKSQPHQLRVNSPGEGMDFKLLGYYLHC